MKKNMRLFLAFFAGIFAIALIAGGIWWAYNHKEVEENIRATILKVANERVNGRIEIDRLSITFPPAVKLEGIRVIDKEGNIPLSSPHGEVTVHYWELLRGDFGAGLIDTVSFQNPHILLKEKQANQWNLSDLMRADDVAQTVDMDMTIQVQNGSIQLERLENIYADMDLNGQIHIGKQGKVTGNGNVVIDGDQILFQVNWADQAGSVRLRGRELQLSNGHLAWLPSQEPKITNWQGVIRDYRIVITRQADGTWQGEGVAKLTDAGLDIYDLKLSGWSGSISGTEKELTIQKLQGFVNGEPVDLMGKISYADETFPIDLTIETPGFNLAKVPLPKLPPIQGIITGKVRATGSIFQPLLVGDLSLEHMVYDGVEFGTLHSTLRKEGATIQLVEITGEILDGVIGGKGLIDWEGKSGDFHLDLSQVSLWRVPAHWLPAEVKPLQGLVSGTFDGKGTLDNFTAKSDLYFASASIAGVPIGSLAGEARVEYGALTFADAKADIANGKVEISGDHGRWQVQAKDIQAELIGPIKEYVRGTFDADVDLTKFRNQWTGQVEISGRNGEVAHQPFDQLQGKVVLGEDGIARIEKMVMSEQVRDREYTGILEFVTENGKTIVRNPVGDDPRFPKDKKPQEQIVVRSHQVAGWALINGDDSYVTISSKNIRAENFLPFMPPNIYVSGNMDNELLIQGNLRNPAVNGSMKLMSGSLGTSKETSVLLDGVSGNYQRQDGSWILSDFTVANWNFFFRADGRVNENGAYAISVHNGQFDLARPFMWNWPYPVEGIMNFSGHIEGAGKTYQFDTLFSSPKIMANGQGIQNFKALASGNESKIQVSEISFAQEQGRFFFEGNIDGRERSIFGDLKVQNAHLSNLLPLGNLVVPELEGTLNGTIRLEGKYPHIRTRVTAEITDGTFRRQNISKVVLDAEGEDRDWKIHKMEAYIGESGYLAAEGGIDRDRNISIEFAARDIDASLLPDLAYMDLPLAGKLQIAAQINGTVANPEAALSAVISPGSFGGTSFDEWNALFLLKDHKISIEQLTLRKGAHQISAYGAIPLAAVLAKEEARTESMDLTVRLDNADLSILPAINPLITQAQGPAAGNLHIKGTLAKPEITGNVSVTNGIMHFDKVKNPLEDIQLNVEFNGSTFVIKEGHAKMGKGLLTVSGEGGLEGAGVKEYHASIKADKLEVNSPYYKGAIDGELKLASGLRQPLLSGVVNLEKVTISIPVSLLIKDSGAFYLPTVGLDVQINVGDKVRFYDPVFYDISPRGELHLRRTLQSPALEGYLEATSGRIWYFGSQFEVTDAKADFQPFQGVIPTINLNAQYRMVNTSVALHAQGLATEMTFNLTSDPPMSQEEIRNLLLFKTDQVNINSPEFQNQLASSSAMAILEMGLQSQGLFGFEEFAKNTFGIDEIQLTQIQFYDEKVKNDSGSSDFEANYGMRIGKALGDKLYLTYTVSFENAADGIATLRYDFNRYWNISGGVERYDSKNRFQIFLRGRFW